MSLSDSAAFSHFTIQARTTVASQFGFSTFCSPAEWFNRSELRHSPQANNFLRWCLSCASTILSACSGQKSEICFKEKKKIGKRGQAERLIFSYVSGAWTYEAVDVFWKIIWERSKSPEGRENTGGGSNNMFLSDWCKINDNFNFISAKSDVFSLNVLCSSVSSMLTEVWVSGRQTQVGMHLNLTW